MTDYTNKLPHSGCFTLDGYFFTEHFKVKNSQELWEPEVVEGICVIDVYHPFTDEVIQSGDILSIHNFNQSPYSIEAYEDGGMGFYAGKFKICLQYMVISIYVLSTSEFKINYDKYQQQQNLKHS